MQAVWNQLRYIPQALGIVWQAAPGWVIASLLLLVAQGLLPVATVFLTREVVNRMVVVVGSGADWAALQPALGVISLMAGVMVINELIGAVAGYVRMVLAEQVQDRMTHLIHTQAISLDLQFYESPDYYDTLFRAGVEAIDRPLALLESLNSLLQNLITLAAMAGVLLTFAWWMPLVLLLGTAPTLWAALRITLRLNNWRRQNTFSQRRLVYLQRVLIWDKAAAELRIFGLADHFIQAYGSLRQRLRAERLSLAREQMTTQMGAGLFGLATSTLALAYMAWRAVQGLFNLGDLAMFFQAMNQGQRLMRGLLTGLSDIYRSILFLEDLFTFLGLTSQLQDPAHPTPMGSQLQTSIQLDNITFAYNDSKRAALQEFNLTIPAGKIVAIVGENGAGKSTLIKLLCRFYDPDQGQITWDGVDLRQVAQEDLRRRITVLFQEPFPYHESMADNIRFGDLQNLPDQAHIEQAARAGGAASIAAKLSHGYETVLGRWFGHTDLSQGEWQRVALARAFVRQADLVILDEPTSAMDSWAENEWMGRFRELVAERTALIITHRFTTAMQADIIHVMVDGRIIESGSHAELVALGGRYAESWGQQMREAGRRGT